jgi:hypothetical protein
MGIVVTEFRRAPNAWGHSWQLEAYGYIDSEDTLVGNQIPDVHLGGTQNLYAATLVHSIRRLAIEINGVWHKYPAITLGSKIGIFEIASEELIEAIEDAKLGWNIEKELYGDDNEVEDT